MNLVKLQDIKINIQKAPAFLYTNNEKTEREIKETLPFTTATKRIKYLGVYLPKETKDLYSVITHIYMEFRKMVMITLYAKQKKRRRCTEQIFGLCGRRRGWDVSREQHRNMYII